jgi:hypothetical protein
MLLRMLIPDLHPPSPTVPEAGAGSVYAQKWLSLVPLRGSAGLADHGPQ